MISKTMRKPGFGKAMTLCNRWELLDSPFPFSLPSSQGVVRPPSRLESLSKGNIQNFALCSRWGRSSPEVQGRKAWGPCAPSGDGVLPDPQVVLTPQTQGCTGTARTWAPLAVLLFSGLHFHLAQSSAQRVDAPGKNHWYFQGFGDQRFSA